METTIRPESAADAVEIRALLLAAFGGTEEATLVEQLRRRSAAWSLVATQAEVVVGAITVSPVRGRPHRDGLRAVGLAPMAVRPDVQRRGIGSALVRAGIEECRRRGAGLIVVLGHPGYYPRFGFASAAAIGLRCRWSADPNARDTDQADSFMYLEVIAGHARLAGDFVEYAPEFDLF